MTKRFLPMWDALRKREALEQAERRDQKLERVKIAPEFLTKKKCAAKVVRFEARE